MVVITLVTILLLMVMGFIKFSISEIPVIFLTGKLNQVLPINYQSAVAYGLIFAIKRDYGHQRLVTRKMKQSGLLNQVYFITGGN
ncbi:hypothetical protein LCR_02945 [Aeromonas enteropelogenes]|uniref:Uncharacterized protein n=1 Tax=Aeromonas enteropelogenes TaxID=29489 RepID=A0A175VEX7_AEREN|nr:hypothetical protein LCR_02945 [Aeromonas enteropelogenes]